MLVLWFHHMRIFLALVVAVIIIAQFVDVTELSQAPLLSNVLDSTKEETEVSSSFRVLDEQKSDILTLLEQTIDENHDLEQGASIIDLERQAGNNDPELQNFEAKIIGRSLNFEDAAAILENIDHEDVALLRAAIHIALDDRDKATDFLHRIVDHSTTPELKSTALSLLTIYARYDKHRDTDPSYLWTLFAQKLGELGEPEISLYLANKAVELKPEYRDAWIIKGYNELILKNASEAEISLLRAYKADPGNPHVQYLLGLTYYELDKPELSTEYLLFAQQNASPYQLEILQKLGENAITLEEYALSAYYYEEALGSNPVSKAYLSRLIWLYTLHLDDNNRAREHALALVEYHSNDPKSYELLSWVETQRGNFPEASLALEAAESLK